MWLWGIDAGCTRCKIGVRLRVGTIFFCTSSIQTVILLIIHHPRDASNSISLAAALHSAISSLEFKKASGYPSSFKSSLVSCIYSYFILSLFMILMIDFGSSRLSTPSGGLWKIPNWWSVNIDFTHKSCSVNG